MRRTVSPAKAGAQAGVRRRAAPTQASATSDLLPHAAGEQKLSYKDQRDYDRLPGEIERLRGARLRRTKLRCRTPTSMPAIRSASPS